MGNQNSHQTQAPVEVVRRPPSRPRAPPSARPLSELGPRGPSYRDEDNRVLPKELPIMRLRPVSMELTKVHPDFESMFQIEDDIAKDVVNGEMEHNENKENETEDVGFSTKGSPRRPPPPAQNGHIPGMTPLPVTPRGSQMSNGTVPVANGYSRPVSASPVSPQTGSVLPDNKPVYRPAHRRQNSAANINLTSQEHTIFEEPEEPIERRQKLNPSEDPFNQSYPGVSLPVKNNFNLDYSYQLTYVQLAEHRRQKTLEELEKRTGKKLSDLSADLSENADKPAAFKRNTSTRASTRSTTSEDSGHRKKKAPPPPTQTPPKSPGATTPRKAYSLDYEPPADYDLSESPRREVTTPRSASKAPPLPPPPVFPAPPPPPPVGQVTPRKQGKPVSRQNSMGAGTPEIILRKTPTVKATEVTTEVPWLLEIKNMSESMAAKRQMSQESTDSTPATPVVNDSRREMEGEAVTVRADPVASTKASQPSLVFESSPGKFTPDSPMAARAEDRGAKLETEEKPSRNLVRQNSLKEPAKPASPKLMRHHSSTTYDRLSTPNYQRQASTPSSAADPVRRLNSLLQHDIKAAAQAQCRKLVKQTTPVPPKPKDPHQVFREQLAKASKAREERSKNTETIDQKLAKEKQSIMEVEKKIDETEVVQVKTPDPKTEKQPERQGSRKQLNQDPELKPKPRYHKNVSINRNNPPHIRSRQRHTSSDDDSESRSPRQAPKNSRDNRMSSTSYDWAPEDDLDSEDNMSDRDVMTTSRKSSSEGFKSSIVPNNMSEMKTKKKGKNNKSSPAVTEYSEDQPVKNKYGSIKRFKKSMHKGVKNAFGSLSKASGKILRKQKAEELETADDVPRNWKLSTNGPFPNGHVTHGVVYQNGDLSGDRSHKYRVQNGYTNHESDDSDTEMTGDYRTAEKTEFSDVIFRSNGDVHPDDESSEEEEVVQRTPRKMKRAGVAYVGAKGQLVVLPDYEDVEVDEDGLPIRTNDEDEGKAPKIFEKKKKYAYDATVRRKEREATDEKVTEGVRAKERQIEEERRKQLQMELEFHKIREAETRERLQRLEAAQMQHQFHTQLQHQQHQAPHHQHHQQYNTMLSAPPLPPAGTFPPNYNNVPDLTQGQNFSNLFGQAPLPANGLQPNFGLGYNPQTPMMNGTLPYDVNDYMRMMGIQTPPSSQQVAYLLNSVNWTGQPPLQGFDKKANPLLYDMFNLDQMKQFSGPTLEYPVSGSTGKTQNFPLWSSAPSVSQGSDTAVTDKALNEFSSQYQYGANSKVTEDSEKRPRRNPLYSSDDSDEGLSPKRTVARAQVSDYREVHKVDSPRRLPVRTESAKFMEKYRSDFQQKPNDNNSGAVTVQVNGDVSHSMSTTPDSSSLSSSSPSPGGVPVSPVMSTKLSVGAPASPAMATKVYGPSGHKTVVELNGASANIHISHEPTDHKSRNS